MNISNTLLPVVTHEGTIHLVFNMVLLTMTDAMVRSIRFCHQDETQLSHPFSNDGEPSLEAPAVGNPISHSQVIAISRDLRKKLETALDLTSSDPNFRMSCHLDELLRGSKVYVEPPQPKAEPVSLVMRLLQHQSLTPCD